MKPFKPFVPLLTFLLLLSFSIFSQTTMKLYVAKWKKVDDLVSKQNLPKSALTEVKNIYALAKKENQDAQVIKAVVYMIGLQADIREDNQIAGIKEIEKEIISNKEPVVSIFKSLLAEQYWNYFKNNRWIFYDRTETKQFKKEDISTWSAGDFHKKITELYLQSIKNETLLQQTKLDPFDAIIIKGNVRHLRPTLYDLLAHRALDYFKNDERDIAKPAYAFEIDQASAFEPAADFIRQKFITKDSASLKHKALLVYQELISFHLKDAKLDALIDADIQRLEFVNENSVHENKKELYRTALEQLGNKYKLVPAAAQAWYLLAKEFVSDADEYKPFGDSTHRFAKLKAKNICENILQQKDSSEGKTNCYNLLNEIKSKDLKFTVEKVNVPGQPFRSLIHYKNIGTVFFRLIKPGAELKEMLINYYDQKVWNEMIAAAPIKSWQQTLPETYDYQQHAVEVKIDVLPPGEYILLAASDNFSKEAIMGARLFYVSNISFVNQDKDYFVLNRETGKPLETAAVQVWEQRYDNKLGKYIKEKTNTYKTDANGFFKINKPTKENYNYSYALDITYNGERFFMDDWMHDYYYNNRPAEPEDFSVDKRQVFFFTDRSIYRPGQIVYFKGITIIPDKEKKTKVLTDFTTTVYLKDVNDQLVDSLILKTNEYGSISGKFQLPQGVLNGEFSLEEKEGKGSINFSVEEYKRPKFYVEYEKIKGSFKVNDKIKVTGLAKAYAGNNIDGANVKYRVVREPRYIYPWLFSRWWQPPTEQMEIAHGEIKTDKDGKFIIEFAAIPDKTIDKKLDPVFDYKIYADVTDINGETRSGETIVSVSYKSLLLKVDLPGSLPADSLKTISISTENMAGEFVPAKLKVTISKLKEEKRLIRSRYWERADQFVMTKQEYIKNFPHDEYADESDYKSWEKGQKVFEKEDSVHVSGEWSVVSGQWSAGFYVIEISTKDKNGEEVKDIKYIELTDDKNNQLTQPKYLWTESSNKPIEPGEKTTVKLGTSADNLFVVQQLEKKTSYQQPVTSNYQFVNINNEKKSFDFSATEADRGGYGVGWFFIKNNRFYSFNKTIAVPWTNKDLKIEYASFRDKTLPGSEEKWKVKITGYKKELVAAEMLGSMYDASLDQFKFHSWNKPSIWPYYYPRQSWMSTNNFSDIESQKKPGIDVEGKYVIKNYDELLGNLFQQNDLYGYGRGNIRRMIITSPVMMEKVEAADLKVEDQLDSEVSTKKNLTSSITVIQKQETDKSQIQIRKNFSETAFFFPDLRTDSSGSIEFSFTIPEALTKWKFQAFTHTKDLAFGYSSKEIITQKDLMVQPNAPRFLREGDKIEFSGKIVNLTSKEITGQVSLQLFDATTNEPVDGRFRNAIANQYFTVAAGQSEAVIFPVEIPYQFKNALTWRIVAKAGDKSDGEENTLPVLTNRMLVTETLPLNMRGAGTKSFIFEKLVNNNSKSLQHQSLIVEYTSNSAWYAVQALPYLMEYPYECAEQTWNRFYANALASKIANSSPRIKQIFSKWLDSSKTSPSGGGLVGALQKNQELKAVLLEETPWVLQAKTEEQQKKNIALLFDLVRMSNEMNSAFEKLKQMQSDNGGFVWFKGGPDNPYITQYIVTGIGHLKKLGVDVKKLSPILDAAIPYLDKQIKKSYDDLKKYKTDLIKYTPGNYEVQYLYMRSFFSEIKIPAASQTAYTYFRSRTQKTWMKQSKYMQGMIALALSRTGDAKTPAAILKSLKETSIVHDELGMYWKENSGGMYWHQAPIETQSLLIETFQEISKDVKTVDDLKTWLLKNKQTTNWKTTKATAEACYALMLQGSNWLTDEPVVEISLGNYTFSSTDNKTEAGTGYFKKSIDVEKIKPEMGNISVTTVSSRVPLQGDLGGLSWGGVYWQYFEDLDKITTATTPLKLDKKLFVETNTDRGPVLTPIAEESGETLKVGNKIKVRIELRVDRDMEYVHMKDMRASGLEPVNVLSGYKWQGGLGYYETTKDASTNFFFDYLRKGTYVFEYSLFVTHKGNFSNGITSIQCMYAPEFTSHSEGIRLSVE